MDCCCFCIDKWREYQHYGDRRPAWIKLHAKLIDNPKWRLLTDTRKAHLVSIWMLASRLHDDPETEPVLPVDSNYLSALTGCRITDESVQDLMSTGFLAPASTCEHNASDSLSLARAGRRASVSSSVSSSVEKEGSGEKEGSPNGFGKFWEAYPRKIGKRDARKAWKQVADERPPVADVVERLESLSVTDQWQDKRYIPYPATWLRRGGWEDTPGDLGGKVQDRERAQVSPEDKELPDPW